MSSLTPHPTLAEARATFSRKGRRKGAHGIALALGAMLVLAPAARAAEAGKAIHLKVGPSGYESEGDRLDRMMARRMRESEFLFRHICRGCGPAGAGQPAGTFNPQATLGGAAPPSRSVERDAAPATVPAE